MRQCLLVLDMDLLAADEQLDLELINHFVARQEQEPCEIVVLSMVTDQPHLPATELLLGAQIGKFPVAPRPDHDISAAAEHRMRLAMHDLRVIGCRASGVISDEGDPVKAVRSETRGRHYEEVILAISRQGGGWLTRLLHLDPVHRLRRHWGQRLTVFRPEWPHSQGQGR